MRGAILACMLALAAPSSGLSHAQQPGYRSIYAEASAGTQTYVLKNAYAFPATYEIEVLDKGGKPLDRGWKLLEGQETYKLEPGSSRRFTVLINMKDQTDQKLLVCSTLKAIGYEESIPGNVSRICSRLRIRSLG